MMLKQEITSTIHAKRRKRINWKHIILHAVLIFLTVVSVFPFVWMISSSLKSTDLIFSFPPKLIPRPVTWENYSRAWETTRMGRAMLNSLFIATLATIGNCLTSSMVAYSFAKIDFKGKNVIFLIVLSTMMIPFQVTLIPLFIIFKSFGWINTYYPLIVPSFFGKATNVFMMRQYMMKIPNDFRDSGFIDGCGHFRIWWRITLPMCIPTLVSLGVLSFMGSWNSYLGPMIYLSSAEKMTVPLVLRTLQGTYTTEWQLLMAASCLALLPVILLYLFSQRYIISGIMLGGIKG